MGIHILVLNLGSTSTKVAIFEDKTCLFESTLRHPTEVTSLELIDQTEQRYDAIMAFFKDNNFDIHNIDIVSARGGLLKPVAGGTYEINDKMMEDLTSEKFGKHASNLSGIIAHRIKETIGVSAVITDPVVVDELLEEVRMTGIKGIERKSIFHALNQKAVARKFAETIDKNYEDLNVIVAHMGGGITVGAHRKGKVIDVNDGLAGEGPLSPTRSGSIPNDLMIKHVLSNNLSYDDAYKLLTREGGFVSLANTQDALELENKALAGDKYAEQIYTVLAIQLAKEVASRAAVLKGEVDQIIFTGGLAYSKYLMELVKPYISFIADITVYPGEEEMQALAEGAYRVYMKEEEAKIYE
ncbi:MAG TPA: butyrate kinase [Aliicoccus persicus]|uniref:Probable butyrate kinase n=1 Tax=Aliicoccus persicus TaxID=930138 RepID=A0A921JCR1_9STAP|nr:butyrate kinase [Aliicoccus persicus]